MKTTVKSGNASQPTESEWEKCWDSDLGTSLRNEEVYRRIMDTTVKMADKEHLWVESVVIDGTREFVLESIVHLITKEIVRSRGEIKIGRGITTKRFEGTIRNLANLAGIVLGPGVIRQSKELLGPSDDCGFVMDAIVESARTVKQLNDSSLEVPTNLETFDAVALKTFEMKVRPDLVNSCVPYQDGIEETFVGRGVYPTVRADLYGPKPGQVYRFRRDKVIEVRILGNLIHLQEYMYDDSHEMSVSLRLEKKTKRVLNVETNVSRVPYHNICELPFIKSKVLVGLKADNGFGERVRELLGGPPGCTHLVDMVLDTIRYLKSVK